MASTTVNSITVNVNNFQQAYDDLGLGPVPSGTLVPKAVATIQAQLTKNVQTQWPGSFPQCITTQVDSAIMTPWSDSIAGSAPSCAVQAISTDFNSWGLPSDNTTFTDIAQEITQQISNHGGRTNVFYGQRDVAGAETIYWGIAFTTAVVVDNPEQVGIIYSFCAVLGIN